MSLFHICRLQDMSRCRKVLGCVRLDKKDVTEIRVYGPLSTKTPSIGSQDAYGDLECTFRAQAFSSVCLLLQLEGGRGGHLVLTGASRGVTSVFRAGGPLRCPPAVSHSQ